MLLSLSILVLGGFQAGGGDDPARADGWLDLDRALAALVPGARPGTPTWGALIRAFETESPKEGSGGTTDISGLALQDVDVYGAANFGGMAWRVSADLAGGNARLEDAHVAWGAFDSLALTIGQFKPRVMRSGSIPPDGLLFRERTFLGAAFDTFDDGVELGGHYDQFDYWLDVTDAENGQRSDHMWSVRGEWALYDSAGPDIEGARGAANLLCVVLGATKFEDVAASAADGGGYGADLALTFGPWAAHAEWANLDQKFLRPIDVFNGLALTVGDGEPNSITVSRRLGKEAEIAFRIERADDPDHTHSAGGALDWNPSGGPARFVVDVQKVEANSLSFSMVSVGVALGSSGLSRPFAGR